MTWCVSAQVEFNGKIVDTYSGFPITNAIILDLESSERTDSNSNGEFQINKTGALEISAEGYIFFIYDRENSNYAII
ncbi:MAG: hypothetical protein R3213_08005, partial [Flavobacteriaceae bacterium]|nr:hypothetical protein [Flavobacteriaceae bacterium]